MQKLLPVLATLLLFYVSGCKKTSEIPKTDTESKLDAKQNVADFLNGSGTEKFKNGQNQITEVTDVDKAFAVNIEGASALKTYFVTVKKEQVKEDKIIVLANFDEGVVDKTLVNKIVNNESTNYSGLVIHKSSQNRYMYEVVYKNGQVTETRLLESRPSANITSRCTAYFLNVYVNAP
jgi:hypothetical protein